MTGGGTLSINICPLFPLPHVQGVVVTPSQTVLINNWGACRMGDIIQEVNHQQVHNTTEFEAAMRNAADNTLLLVNRQGNTMFLAV